MAVPRPVLLALLGLALVASLIMMTRGGQDESVTPAPKAQPAPSPAPKDGKAKSPEARNASPADKPATSQGPATSQKPVARKPQVADDVPPQVRKAAAALARDEVVVFFFSSPGPADDTGARVSVRALERMRGVSVFKAGIDQLADYRPMLANLGISQVPATAIVRPGRRAVLLQGFVDSGTLRQHVADARR